MILISYPRLCSSTDDLTRNTAFRATCGREYNQSQGRARRDPRSKSRFTRKVLSGVRATLLSWRLEFRRGAANGRRAFQTACHSTV